MSDMRKDGYRSKESDSCDMYMWRDNRDGREMVRMIPFAVMRSEAIGLPTVNPSEVLIKKTTFPFDSGLKLNDSCVMSVRRAMVQLVTTKELRAAHVFRYGENGEVEWHLFESAEQPLNQAEINGHMIFAIQSIKQGNLTSLVEIECTKRHIQNKNPVRRFLETIDETESVFIILILKDKAFCVGNYFDESTLCNAIVNFIPSETRKREVWRKEQLPFLPKKIEDLLRRSAQ